jgi:hypothetical protein
MWTVLLKFFLLTFWCTYHTAVSEAEVEVEAEAEAETSGDYVCRLYLAPSLTPGCGRGVFAGASIKSAEVIENAVTIAVNHGSIFGMQLDNYIWAAPDEVHIGMAEFGPGMLYNHRNPPLVAHEWPYKMKKSSDQRHAHTTSSPVINVAERDISEGEEIFVSYSANNLWLEERGIVVADVPESSDPPPVRTLAELEEIGHCLTDVKVCNRLQVFLTLSNITP